MSNLKSINDFNKEKYEFIIPSYQRGYRWGSQQVIDLLNDIKEFDESEPKKENFYCVQPLIVQNKNTKDRKSWYVIDGQQRLTTIYIIISYIITIIPTYEINYGISYVTRESSKEFLKKISDSKNRELNKEDSIDFYFMSKCYETIEEWFGEDRNEAANLAIQIIKRLLDQVKFIWYEIEDREDPIETFTRINLGKIPLTNSELIKALLLQRNNFQEENNKEEYTRLKQLEIASEWNTIENQLQEDEFWYFISGSDKYETRIEFLFEVMVESLSEDKTRDREYKIFHFVNNLYNLKIEDGHSKVEAIEYIWGVLKTIYYTFDEWYRDRKLYHYIGFVISEKVKNLSEIVKKVGVLDEDHGLKKDLLLIEIKNMIKESVKINCDLEDLTYPIDARVIRRILLLFNIETLEQSNAPYRFPFYLYKKEKWDLEHIHATKSYAPNRKDDQKKWLEEINTNSFLENTYEGRNIKKKAQDMLNKSINDETFNQLYYEVIEQYGVNNDNDRISNITLLDSQTNKSYKNSPFPIKRAIIIKNDKQGKFIPLCTKNLFLKYYSKDLEQMDFWSEKDETDYMLAINDTLQIFINGMEE